MLVMSTVCPSSLIKHLGSEIQNSFIKVNSLPDDKISDWSKSKQIADDILKCI